MSQAETEQTPALPVEEILQAAAEVAAAPDVAQKAQRLLARLQAWAAPSVIFCMRQDALTESGWRVVTELGAGQVPHAFERFVGKLVDESPAARSKPLLVRPAGEELPGFKLRDTWIIPWSCGEGAQGFLVLRGVAASAPNLGDAVSLASQPLWPAIAIRTAGPELTSAQRLGRLDEAVVQIKQLVERVANEVESARQTAAAPGPEPAAPQPDPEKIDALTRELDARTQQIEALTSDLETRKQQIEGLTRDLEARVRDVDALRKDLEARAREIETFKEEAETRTREVDARAKDADARAKELETLKTDVEALRRDLEEKERRRQEAEAQAEFARGEAGTLRTRIEELEAERGGGAAGSKDVAALQEKLDAAHKGREEAERARDEAQKLSEDTDKAKTAAEGERDRLRAQIQALEDERRGSDQVRLEAGAMQDKLENAEKARATAESERDKLRSQVGQLWASIESLQREVQAGKDQGQEQAKRADDQIRQSQEMFARMQTQLREAQDDKKKAEERAEAEETRWNGALATFRDAIVALRRTPFVPPSLRIGLGELENLVSNDERPAGRARVLLLDRDLTTVESLAKSLEDAGLDVLIAHYPEEVGLFLKTPDSRGLTALVCDVMAFRSDQNLTDLFKGWRQDAGTLSVLLSFRADNTSEAEKAQRVPSTLAAGYLPRPLTRDAIADAVSAIARRQR